MNETQRKNLRDFALDTYAGKIALGLGEWVAKRETWDNCMHFCRGYFCNSEVPFAEVFDEVEKAVRGLGNA